MDRDLYSDRYGGKPYELYRIEDKPVMNLYINNNELCSKKVNSIRVFEIDNNSNSMCIINIYFDDFVEKEMMGILIVYQWFREAPELFTENGKTIIDNMMKTYMMIK